MMSDENLKLEEALFTQLLHQASPVSLPEGAQARLAAMIQKMPQLVVPVAQPPQKLEPQLKPGAKILPQNHATRNRRLLFGVPLAASFLLGILLGGSDWLETVWPAGSYAQDVGYTAVNDDLPSGVDDLETYPVSSQT